MEERKFEIDTYFESTEESCEKSDMDVLDQPPI